MRIAPALLLILAALPSCREEERSPISAEAPQARVVAATQAVEAPLRARLRTDADPQQRGVQVFAQAAPATYAVCGRASASHAPADPLIPYVGVVTFEGAEPRLASLAVGTSGAEATRVFLEMVDRCFEGGGPAPGPTRMTMRSMPPVPTGVMPAERPAPGATLVSTAAAEPASRQRLTVVTSARHGANLRHAPRGEVLRTVPRSSTLEVMGEAPGGWFKVGENGEAFGWVHASVLESGPR
ncbi:SH3 domain-containing protein [Sabulicella rubraurantiaca]|uniref:SH3 domain-containing protein n=1 Tax=Sabulicella rubraurantiaca TaxID=2811429 RepID=UPI001A95A7EB|nr:SH3 domain-containing protein [Sabulicella rubraurantiaca]